MRRRLVLIRHARAQDRNAAGDHERTLTDGGRLDARELGRWLAGQDLAPDQVIVSTAARARQTLAEVLQGDPQLGGGQGGE